MIHAPAAFFRNFLAGAGLLAALACGGGGGTATATRSTTGTINVALTDGPAPGYQEINLNIQSVQIHTSSNPGESGWITLSEPKKTYDLLKLRNGLAETLAAGKTLDPGQYQQLRLVLGATGNTLKLADNSTVNLEVPSAQQTGIKMPLSFTVAAGTTADIWIDFDGAHSIQLVGNSGPAARYLLRPVVKAYDKVATGGVTGTLKAGTTLLANALVLAESVDAIGNVTVLRTTTTNASGAFTLGLLPIGQPFYLVSQPVVGPTSYLPQASAALTLSPAAPTATWNGNGDFVPATTVGGANGRLTPAATSAQSDVVQLLGSVPTGSGGTALLAVSTANGVIGTPDETFAFTSVPAAAYKVQALRSTLNPDGTTTVTRSAFSPTFSVNQGTSTVQNVAF